MFMMLLATIFTGAALAGVTRAAYPSLPGPAPLFILGQAGAGVNPMDVLIVGGAITVLLGMVMTGVKFFRMIWPTRTPAIEVEFATKAEVKAMIAAVITDLKEDQDRIEDKLTDVEKQMHRGFEELRRDGSIRASGIHKRIDDIGEGVSGVRQVLDLITKNLNLRFNGGSN
jgi:hypothetical protein